MNKTVAVLDIGKTFSKLSLWDDSGESVAQASTPNASRDDGPIRVIDTDAMEAWVIATLHEFAAMRPVDVIIPVAHGATGALIRNDRLACPVFDYESPVPQKIREPYDSQRDAFHDTGSPAQSLGLNLGVQLHWLEKRYPDAFSDDAQLVTWPQFWAWRLSGVAATEVTSLACHTDLWLPEKRKPSSLADARGWTSIFAPMRDAGDTLGTLRPEIAAGHDGLRNTEVLCGIHDSNASLLGARSFEQFSDREFTTLATGTWFVTMRTPGDPRSFTISSLPENRDCLVNCDLNGNMVPTSLFMGGRELNAILGEEIEKLDTPEMQDEMLEAVPRALDSNAMLLPTFTPGVGPYPHNQGQWRNEPTDPAERCVAACLYAALVTETSLTYLGSTGRVLIDGRFAKAAVFARGLAALRPDIEFYTSDTDLDLALGALQLIGYGVKMRPILAQVSPLEGDLGAYTRHWRDSVASTEG